MSVNYLRTFFFWANSPLPSLCGNFFQFDLKALLRLNSLNLPLTLLVAGLLLSGSLKAQLVDSLSKFLKTDPSFMAKFDTRHSFITSRYAKIFGFKLGLDHNGRVQYGGGMNWLVDDDSFDQEIQIDGGDVGDTVVGANLNFAFFSPYFEYTFYKSKHWEVTIPVQIGLGRTSFEYVDRNGNNQELKEGAVFTYEPAMTVQYKFWRYFGVGVGVGYRLMLLPNPKVNENFTSPIYMFRAKVFFGKIYRDIFPKKPKKK